ncbi:hypothetical protein DL93DRAFT_345955 [Clavulina sp. PMI_390]|nr:hypothetical protein DL93DRAFT_345955 [Clavulina sp. PMI_390]
MADVAQSAQLLYLVIINPTLKPPAPTDDDDDYEQASILFYTSHSRAVSRDTMLRQVGLAKALINFSELFTPEAGCDNVHSQKKRMIMLSPEQNFWIHICVQVPTETRPPPASQKTSKSKSNASSKGKGKETPPPPTVEYVDSGLHDSVLRADLQAAYEGFRLVHGTFQEILDAKGIATLEGLLEQYFNVWAWKWDVNVPLDLPIHLGTPLHPKHSRLQYIMEELCAGMPSSSSSFVLYHNPPSLIAPPYTRLSFTTIEGETSLADAHNDQVEEKEEKNAEERDVRALITYMLTLTQPKLLPTTSSSLGSNNIDALSNTQPAGNGSLHSRIASLSDSTSTIIPPAPSTLSSATIRPHPPSQQASSSTAASIVNGLLPTSISGTPTPSPSPSSTSISPSLPANPLSTALAIPGARPLSQLGSTMAAPFTHAGSYIVHNANPRKWWPDYLTIPTGSTKGGSAGVAEKDKEKEEQEQGTTTTAASTDVPSSAPADGAIGDQEPSAAPTTTDSTEEIGKDTETKTDTDSDEGDDDEESEAESGEGDVAVADASPNAAANDEDTSAAIPDPASRWDSPRVVVEQDDERKLILER